MTTRELFEVQVHRQRGHDRGLFPRNAGRSVGFEFAESPLISTPRGRYTVKAKTSAGLSAKQSFEVKDQKEAAHVIRITLKPGNAP